MFQFNTAGYIRHVDFAVVRELPILMFAGNFVVKDVDGNIIYKVDQTFSWFRDRRALLDAVGNPIFTLRRKLMTTQHEWKVYRGSSKEPSDLVFSAIKSSMFQFNTKLHVFLASNTTMNAPDFMVQGSWMERSCVIYAGDSSTIVAEMHKKLTVQSVLFGKDNFMVRVYPGTDYAFIVALIVILDAVHRDSRQH